MGSFGSLGQRKFMQNLRQHLPRLDRLIAFEAAARLGSFTHAAAELNLTQSAISHSVKMLEADLGVALFRRAHRAVHLTAEGATLLNSVTQALSHLSAASQGLRADRPQPLRLYADVAMAQYWLLPRLSRLQAALPGVLLELIVSDAPADARAADVALLQGNGAWPDRVATRLFAEEIVPVCAPAYLERHGPIESVPALADADLIDLKYEQWAWANWTIWFTEMGAPRTELRRVLESNLYAATMQMAADGCGVALGWRRLVEDDLLSGRLVVPVPAQLRMPTGYYLVCPPGLAQQPTLAQIKTWLMQEISTQRLAKVPDLSGS